MYPLTSVHFRACVRARVEMGDVRELREEKKKEEYNPDQTRKKRKANEKQRREVPFRDYERRVVARKGVAFTHWIWFSL